MENPICSRCQKPIMTAEEIAGKLCAECAAEQSQAEQSQAEQSQAEQSQAEQSQQPGISPACGYHPESEAVGICNRCGTFICHECLVYHTDSLSGEINAYCRACYEKVQEASYYCAWEDRSVFFYRRFWITWKEIIFHPHDFFEKLPRTPDKTSALTFAYLSSAHAFFMLGISIFWGYSIPSLGLLMGGTLGLIGIATVWLFSVPLWLYVYASSIHLGVRVQFKKREFHQTFRIIGYASATQVASMIPGINLIAGIFNLVIIISGLKRVQKLSTLEAILAMILPVLIGIAIIVLITIWIWVWLPVHV